MYITYLLFIMKQCKVLQFCNIQLSSIALIEYLLLLYIILKVNKLNNDNQTNNFFFNYLHTFSFLLLYLFAIFS